ncbi:hypothetical protein [Mongoliitalea daihaiensis]|uniref:hypothetical protein n=1 Tax=Mongoliitalea daihaiensis TaxID=2782006 RepID=UPI001F28D0FF|nr:hypothetical protein [Mongoliitalea daihaiensis]UJP64431.1 hypothetical protein IPZ59_16735 [Mongoliitalea daihaiensis]
MKKHMNYFKHIFALLVLPFFFTACILEDQEPEYDVVGAVGTIATLTASSTTPEVGGTVTFTMTVYSEHEPATELRMNRVQGGTTTTLETRNFANWNTQDSYVETFQWTVPENARGTAVTMQFVLVTQSNFTRSRNITINVRP